MKLPIQAQAVVRDSHNAFEQRFAVPRQGVLPAVKSCSPYVCCGGTEPSCVWCCRPG